jgi:flavin-dependent dehydrogenase
MRHARVLRTTGAFVPVGGPLRKTYSSAVVLTGEAAGHVMASNGGGVPTALVGGELAGQAAVQYLTKGVALAWYELMWKKQIGSELYSALAIRRIADQVMISDSLCDQTMRLAGTRYLKHLIRCRLPWPVSLGSRSIVKILKWLEPRKETP